MKLLLTLLLAFSVLSCSSGTNKAKVRYKDSVSMPSLDIPPDLTGINDSSNKALPGSKLGTKSAIGRYKDTGPLLDKVLPKITGVKLEGDGAFYWLEVNQSPTALYSVLKSFWADEGFTLELDEPLLGIMKTEWLENKASILSSDGSSLGRFLSLFKSTDTEDQYRVRIERGDSDNSSRIFLTQYGREFILVEERSFNTKSWRTRAPDPELEAEMLSRIMLFLGMQDEQIKLQLTKLGQFPTRAQLVKNDIGITTLVVKESFDRGWNRVLSQLDRLNVKYDSKDKAKKLIQFKLDTKNENGLIAMNLKLGETSDNATTLKIVNLDGLSDDSEQATALLQHLFKNLK